MELIRVPNKRENNITTWSIREFESSVVEDSQKDVKRLVKFLKAGLRENCRKKLMTNDQSALVTINRTGCVLKGREWLSGLSRTVTKLTFSFSQINATPDSTVRYSVQFSADFDLTFRDL